MFLGLGICVFAWGLQYKLSLYYPAHSTFHQVPAAKLLSKNEQPAAQNLRVPSENQPPGEDAPAHLTYLMLAWLTALVLCLPLNRRRIPALERPWLRAARASFYPFFFRPPPTSA